MATPRKRTTKKSTTKKTTTKRKTPTKAKRATATKRVKRTSTTPKKTMKPAKSKSKWYSVLTFSVIVLVVAAAGFLSMNPGMLDQLQANLLAQLNTSESTDASVSTTSSEGEGLLLTWKEGGENEEKLKEIFRTVFPETSIAEVNYLSEEGQSLVRELGTREVPNIYFEQRAFENEALADVVKDLFELRNGYYGLNVSLVNPSHQLHIGATLQRGKSISVGSETAPLEVTIYSDAKCQHCRVMEKNNLDSFVQLADEGIARLYFVDLPQTSEAQFHSVALHCVGTRSASNYVDFRRKLFTRANLTNAFTKRELETIDIDYDNDCDEAETRRMLRSNVRMADQDGVSGVPAIYINRTGENEAIRITGSKTFDEYERIFDDLLGEEERETEIPEPFEPLEDERAEGLDDDAGTNLDEFDS